MTDEKADISGEQWFCHMNTWDPQRANCQAEEENNDDDEVAQAALQSQNAAIQAEQAAMAAAAKKPAKRKKKKAGSDDDDEDDTSATNSADEAFYSMIDAAPGRRSGRATKAPGQFASGDYAGDSDDDRPKKKVPRVAVAWTADQDDALLSAIVKHGIGAWTNMLKDPEYAHRFEGLKATALRNRWKKVNQQTTMRW